MYTLATLYQLRRRLGLDATDTGDDDRLLAALQAASAEIEHAANRRFTPHRATLKHSITPRYPTELLLSDDLLDLDALTNGNGQPIDLNDIQLIPDTGLDGPVSLLRLENGAAFVWEESPLFAVTVSGLWGWHDRWSRAWEYSRQSLQVALNATDELLSVNDAAALNTATHSPRFQVGQLIRLEAEYLRVLGVDALNDTLTVQRGVNGTSASPHPSNTPLEIFQPPLDVETLCLRWAAWLYKESDSRSFTSTPPRLTGPLASLRRLSVRS